MGISHFVFTFLYKVLGKKEDFYVTCTAVSIDHHEVSLYLNGL